MVVADPRVLKLGDHSIAYREAGAGPPLVLLFGSTQGAHRNVVAHVSTRELTRLFVSARGSRRNRGRL
jgi:hypothetical protein